MFFPKKSHTKYRYSQRMVFGHDLAAFANFKARNGWEVITVTPLTTFNPDERWWLEYYEDYLPNKHLVHDMYVSEDGADDHAAMIKFAKGYHEVMSKKGSQDAFLVLIRTLEID